MTSEPRCVVARSPCSSAKSSRGAGSFYPPTAGFKNVSSTLHGFYYDASLHIRQSIKYLLPVPTPRKTTDTIAKTIVSTIPTRLAELRRERGLTQGELAEIVGISRTLLTNYENGRTHLNDESIILLAKALSVSTDQLLGVAQNTATDTVQSIRLVRRMQKIERMPAPDQKALLKTIDKYLADQPAE